MKKPTAKVIGKDGNVFSILGNCIHAIKKMNPETGHIKAAEMTSRVAKSGSYEEALNIMQEYVRFK